MACKEFEDAVFYITTSVLHYDIQLDFKLWFQKNNYIVLDQSSVWMSKADFGLLVLNYVDTFVFVLNSWKAFIIENIRFYWC